MVNALLDPINQFVEAITVIENVTGTQGIEYILIFFLVFSIIFAATGYTPLFKDPRYRGVRILIAIAMGYMTVTVSYITFLAEVLSFFGFFAAFTIGIGSVLYYVMPAEHKEKGMIIAIIAGIILTVWLGLKELSINTDWITPIINWLMTNWMDALAIFTIIFLIFLLIGLAVGKAYRD